MYRKCFKYLLFMLILLFVPKVFAENLTSSEYAFGYYQGASEKLWSGYSSNNSSNYFGVTDPTKAEIVTFNSRFTLSNKFKRDYFYTISYTWYNNYDYNTNYTFYNALQDMGWFELGCYVTNSSSYATGSTCFTNSNITITKKSNTTVNVSITFTPSQDIYRILYQIDSEQSSSGVGFISYEYSITNVGMSVATSGTSEIINNNNQNTQEIINNNNQNTQNIIDNQNQNTQQQIESQNVCHFYDKNAIKTENGYLRTNGTINNANSWGISDYISFKKNSSKLEVLEPHTSVDSASFCQYDINKNLISCSQLYTFTNDYIFDDKVNYIRVSILSSVNKPQFRICTNGNQALTDSLTDSNIDTGTGTGFFDNFTSEDFGLSQIITIPLNTIQSLTSKTCVPLQVPIPFTNSNVTLPCMTEIYETKFPSIYNLWKIVSFGIIAYLIAVDIFHIVKGFKDPESDKVEVLDL